MFVASVGTDLKYYNYEKGTLISTYGLHKDGVKHIRWCDDGKYIVQVGYGLEVEILNMTEEKIRSVQRVPIEEPTFAIFQHGPIRNLAIGCRSGKTVFWDVKFKNITKTFPSGSPVKFLDFNSKNTFLAAALDNGDTNVFNIVTNSHLGNVKVPHCKTVSSLAFHKELRSVLGIATEEGSILLRDLGVSKDRMLLRAAHAAPVTGIAFSPINKDVMTSCSFDKTVLIHDIRLQTIVKTINTEKFLTSIDMSTEAFIVLGCNNGEVLLYDLRNFGKPFHVFSDHKSAVTDVVFQPITDKQRKNCTFNISIKDVCSPKIPTALENVSSNKASDTASFCDLINKTFSPMTKEYSSPIINEVAIDGSHDSSLLNIIDNTNTSSVTNNDSKEFVGMFNNKSSVVSNSSKLKPISQLVIETNDKNFVSTSTPVLSRIQPNETSSQSPIIRTILKTDFDVNANADRKLSSVGFKKSLDSPNCPSDVETVVCNKCNPNLAVNISNDLKDYIRFSTYDIIERCRNNHYQMTIQQTKNRLFLEDQICMMNQKMEGMQHSLSMLLEENKKLLIEMEMLRATKK
ncbi:WD repeat-containing protein Grip71 [Arctopsyche grandis]|uniref:WD repeat-containing protein Grip71 n=1 Tax=Arctopsyche grandis TaxID=121162 RepID=UPI00406D8F59